MNPLFTLFPQNLQKYIFLITVQDEKKITSVKNNIHFLKTIFKILLSYAIQIR